MSLPIGVATPLLAFATVHGATSAGLRTITTGTSLE
jgi:hypothetical protein